MPTSLRLLYAVLLATTSFCTTIGQPWHVAGHAGQGGRQPAGVEHQDKLCARLRSAARPKWS